MDSILKILYDKWFTHNGKQYPYANGTGDKIVEYSRGLAPEGEFDRISKLDKHYYYNDPTFGYYFRNSNLI